jgi:hypothetical protein
MGLLKQGFGSRAFLIVGMRNPHAREETASEPVNSIGSISRALTLEAGFLRVCRDAGS